MHYAICGAKVMFFFDIYNIFFGNVVEKTIDSSYLAFARTITRRARVRQLIGGVFLEIARVAGATFLCKYLLVPKKCCTFAAQNQTLRRYEEADT